MGKVRQVRLVLFVIAIVLTISGCGGKKSAGKYYKEGMEYYKSKEYDKASDSLQQAIQKNPNRADYYISYGMALIQCKNYEEALVQFDRAILDKDNKIVRENNKLAHRGKGITYFKSFDYEKAQKEFTIAYGIPEREELNKDILFYLGDTQLKLLNREGAIDTYTKIIESNKNESTAYFKRAIAKGQSGDLTASVKDFDKAISFDKDNYEYYLAKYAILVQQGDEQGALDVLTQALAIRVNSKEDAYYVALIHFYQKNYDTAKKELQAAAAEGISSAYFYLGEIAMDDKDFTAATENFEKFIKDTKKIDSGSIYNQLGVAYLQIKDYKKALQAIEAGIALNDASIMQPLLSNEIVALERNGEFKKAYEKAQQYCKQYPEDEKMNRELEFLRTRQQSAAVDNTKNE